MTARLLVILTLSLNVATAGEAATCYATAIAQAQLNHCAKLEKLEADAKLVQLINELNTLLPQKPEANLLAAQNAWGEMVAKDCAIESWYLEGGSARSMIVTTCYTTHTQQRIHALSKLLCHPMKGECEARERHQIQP